jgi:threonylcarbamoyladenosine tRNA methylthiotransferase MtaB
MAPKTFKIVTLGCKVNQYESGYLEESLLGAGWSQVSKQERADLTVINTCIVTQRASYQSRQAIRKVIRENPGGTVAAVGCYSQVFPQELARIPGLHLVLGNTVKGKLADIVSNMEASADPLVRSDEYESKMPFELLPVKRFSGRTRGFLKIQDGCRSFCSYCIVPSARGPLRSLESSKVLSMLESLAAKGYREVVLTGINLGKYGHERGEPSGLQDLLRLIGKAALPLRIRLSSIEPGEIDESLLEMVASEDWICRHLHIPFQSGDDRILRKMNRPYRGRQFANLIEEIHKKVPLVAIGVDVMAGFPGEDDRAFGNSKALIADLPISYLHVFPFSPREGTAAAKFADQVNAQIIKGRAAELRSLGHEKRIRFYESCLGREFLVLVVDRDLEEKDMLKGLSDNYLPVSFPYPRVIRNAMIPVRPEKLTRKGVLGRATGPPS